MKISTFCKLFDVPSTTIRYYIKSGILVPYKKNSQYIFTQVDVEEMKLICELKELSFSMDEIRAFLQVSRFYDLRDEGVSTHLSRLYQNKLLSLQQELETMQGSIDTLGSRIKQLKEKNTNSDKVPFSSGIPLSFLSYFSCPTCESLLDLANVEIHCNQIYSGTLTCNCGYTAHVENGIFLANTPSNYYTSPQFNVMHYRETQVEDNDFVFFQYMRDISSEVATLMQKSNIWINKEIQQEVKKPTLIFVPDLASHFLYKHIDSPYFKDAYIIVSGFSKQNILSIKSHIDFLAPQLRIVYIANTIYELPLHPKSIDLWIDANSSYNFSFFHNFSLQSKITKYMSQDSAIIGYAKYYYKNSVSQKNINVIFPNAMKENSSQSKFFSNIKDSGFQLAKWEDLGYATSPGPYYDYHAPLEKHHFYGFYATKSPHTSGLCVTII